ncbi:MAG: sulfate ABC transporter permease subunit CysT [Jatrophihabitans sp.]|uniref:sulfate ABC transporter permease subunit CysT n=1 Tax=Jatrophihabitans sp. TaxID=1932789 RepID=UPI003F7D0CE4
MPTGRRVRRGTDGTRSPLDPGSSLGLGVAVIWLSLLVLIPLAAVVSKAFDGGWGQFVDDITKSTNLDALKLTLLLSVSVAVVNAVMGTLVAWVLVRERFPGARVLEFAIDLPFALPTIVAGLVMLGLYGEDSPLGVSLVGTRIGMFVALLFVTLPFTVRTVQPVLLDLDRDAEQAAASLGAGPFTVFRRIVLPPILPALLSGGTLSFARALGEYGSLVLIASNIPHQTLIASALIYGRLQDADNPVAGVRQAAALATVLLVASAVVLTVLALLQRRRERRG